MDPALRRALIVAAVAVGGAAALAGSYVGVDRYLGRTTPVSVSAGTARATSAPTAAGPQRLVVHGTGDVNLDPRQLGLARTSFAAPWDGVRELFGGDDLTIVNLECAPGAGGVAQEKEFTFRCENGHTEMRSAGVDVANLGNNHSLDYGSDAMLDGRRRLQTAGVTPVGAGRDAREANTAAVFDVKGWKVAVLGFGGVVPEPGWIAGANHPGVADGYATASMVSAVKAADTIADLVFVAIHWGAELDTTPKPDDIARAHALIDAGADAIFGHHAHRLQPLELYNGRPIAYGLGNFVWPTAGSTAVAQVVVEPDGSVTGCLLPARITGGRPALDGASVCPAP
ncbi:MAG: CapA family protein [Actinomycetota bacterium]